MKIDTISMTYSSGREQFANNEIVSLRAGRSSFSIMFDDLSVIQPGDYWNVEIELCWSPAFEGSSAHYCVAVDAIPAMSGTMNSFGDTVIRFGCEWVSLPVAIEFSIDIETVSQELPLNAVDVYEAPLEARRIFARKLQHRFTSRLPQMRLAKIAASQMGLNSVYMNERRTADLRQEVIAALERKRGYSLLRLGDGEGRILGYPDLLNRAELLYQVLYYHFGPLSMEGYRQLGGSDWIDRCILELKALLLDSLDAADQVGFPVVDFFHAEEVEWDYGHIGYAGAMTYLNAYHERSLVLEPIGTNVFQQLARRNDFFGPVARAANRVFTVGPWELSGELAAALAIDRVHHVQVQRHYTWSEERSWGQFPHLYKVTMQRLKALGDLRGCLFLVGAGLPGKAYCAAIKRQGGVALDVGSVFDTWAQKGIPYAVENAKDFSLANLSRDPAAP